MSMLNTFKTGSRAAIVAVILGASAVAAMPAQAAPNFNFSFNMNDGNGVQFGFGNGPKKNYCLSEKQIFWQLKQSGWDNVKILKNKGPKVLAVAQWHHKWYQLVIDRCTGEVTKKPVKKFNNNSNFNITLQF